LLIKANKNKVTSEVVEKTLNPAKYIKNLISNRELAKAQLLETGRYFKANLGEGVQELYQTGAASTLEDYYKNLYNDPRMTGFKYWKASARNGVNSLVSQEGLEAFLGGVLGGGAVNVISKGANLGKETIMQKFSPEKYEKIKLNRQEQAQQLSNLINEEGQDVLKFLAPDIANLVELVEQNNSLAELGDKGNFKGIEDLRSTALYKKIQSLEAAGATDTFIDALSQMKQLEDSEKMEALGVDSVEKADAIIDSIVKRSNIVKSTLQYLEKNFQNPYNPNQYKIGTKERNEEILRQYSYEQAKRDLAFNYNQFATTAERMSELYQSAVKDAPVIDMLNKDFSVLFNTTLADSKKSGLPFETSLESEIALIEGEIDTAKATLKNIEEQLKEAQDEVSKKRLTAEKQRIEKSIPNLENRQNALLKYASSIENVKASRKTTEKGVKKPDEAKSMEEMYEAFEDYLNQVASEKNTFIDKVKSRELFSKLIDFIDLAEDNRLSTRALTILSDPAALKKLSDLHFKAIKNRFDVHKGMSEMLSLAVMNNKSVNEFIEALEEISVVVPVDQMEALIFEDKVPTEFYSENETDVDVNGVVIEGTPLWEKIQELVDQFEMGVEETKDDVKAANATEDTDTTSEEEDDEKDSKKPSMADQAAASQQASKEPVDGNKSTNNNNSSKKAKYQEAQIRKDLKGTKVLEKLDSDFYESNRKLKEAGENQQTFTQFINGLKNIDDIVKKGREEADINRDIKTSKLTLESYQKRLRDAKTVDDVKNVQIDAELNGSSIMSAEDMSKLDFQKRINEIKAEEAKNMGIPNVPDTTPSTTAPTGDNLDQATETIESIDFNEINTSEESEKGGKVTDDDINNLLC
jgi:hypothetical protein